MAQKVKKPQSHQYDHISSTELNEFRKNVNRKLYKKDNENLERDLDNFTSDCNMVI